MMIIGCDYHPSAQQIALVDTDTGEVSEPRLCHREQAEHFYRELKQRNAAVRVGMESSGHKKIYPEIGRWPWDGTAQRPHPPLRRCFVQCRCVRDE